MATPSQPATAATAGAPAPARSSRKIVLALAVLTALAAGGGATFFILRGNAVQAAAPMPVKPIFVTLEPLTVNLQPETRQRFLHVGVTLKVNDQKAQARVHEAMPELRSRLLLLLSNRDPATLSSLDDKLALAEQIKTELNRPLVKGLPAQGIDGVGFTAFVLQ